MIRNRSYILFFVAFLTILSSCTSTKKIQAQLDSRKQSIIYLLDSKPIEDKSDIKLSLSKVSVDPTVRQQTIAVKETGWTVPLLIFNYWESRKMCYQGESNYLNSWAESMQYHFEREAKRSGSFQLDSVDHDYELEITINKVQAIGPYTSNGFFAYLFFMYIYSFGDYAGPADTEVAISYQLKKGTELIHENTFDAKKKSDAFRHGYNNKKELIQTFGRSMAESTSLNFKNVIELIINDLNNHFASV
ncbi:hypothetical protein [Acidiluteibacter ferrifornacis]|uniref:Lipoprotein n=1 Tax=Acidiluteibacter ferrifornacis TaxID=2692424 RepID=A0A6N9NNS3_9FLAO|nr:hypothetical protein [Acidiluteibacter ferrifornacis]MBR9831099.1 hypothetical protein [bacterium]NBG66920.1 hypothetical protein [Acidiluteibacter ferrifornacis]